MSLVRRVRAALEPGGELAARMPRYEARAGQAALAEAIARTFSSGGVLLAEAPTGVGKSLGYLLPGVLHAHESGERVVIATCTRSLQDQLYERDLPMVLDALGLSLPCARLKGKQNYLCPRELDLEDPAGAEERVLLDRLRGWAATDPEGDLDRYPADDPEAFRRMRARVATDAAACTLATCRRGRECFWVRARRQAAEARLVVVNHALLALSGDAQGLLPDFDVLVVDEAHRLESVLLGQLERSTSRGRFEELLRLMGAGRARRRGAASARGGLLARLSAYALPLLQRAEAGAGAVSDLERLARRVEEARADAEKLFAALEPSGQRHALYGLRERYRSTAELLGQNLEPLETMLLHCSELARSLHRLGEVLEGASGSAAGADLAAELEQTSARFAGLGSDLESLTDPRERDWVYWRTAGARGVELHGAPVTAAAHARRLVLGRAHAAVLTSATLSAGGDFDFLAGRLGLGESQGLPYESASVPSPFPLERQMRTLAYTGGGEEAAAVSEVVAALAREAPRNMLVLFTAHERLRRARALLLDRLPPQVSLLAQEWDGSAALVSRRFRERRGVILLGVQSLWEGVDFPGEALEILVVTRLPFSVPDEPLVEARAERLREQGRDPFREDAIPEAVLRFRQGVGRLIRRADDRGVLVVCDPRLMSAPYRRAFLETLAVAPHAHREPDALAAEAARFLAEVEVEEDA